MQISGWTLVFTAASFEHLAEREIDADDVADAVFGQYGLARIRRSGRGLGTRWLVTAPLANGELLSCVLRAALSRDSRRPGRVRSAVQGRSWSTESGIRRIDAAVRKCSHLRGGRDPELSRMA